MKKKFVLIFMLFTFSLMLWGFAVGTVQAKTTFIKIGAGGPGGLWYMSAARLADEISKKIPNAKGSAVPGGAVSNCRKVAAGELQLGLTRVNNTYHAYMGKSPFKKAYTNLRFIATSQMGMLQLVARRDTDIHAYKDLYNKKINPQKIGWGCRDVVEVVMNLYGMPFESIKKNGGVVHALSNSGSQTMMQDRNLDAAWALGGCIPAFVALAERPGVRCIGLDRKIAEKVCEDPMLRGAFVTTWPKGVYKGCDKDLITIAIFDVFCASADMPDDIAYNITKIIYETQSLKDVYKGSVKSGLPSAFNIEQVSKGTVIPVHPGAKRYFKSRGIEID